MDTEHMTPDPNLAVLTYGHNDLITVKPGTYVLCAHTGEKIMLENLKYWSVDRQEAYKDAAAATARLYGERA
jgi:hypothetical protein